MGRNVLLLVVILVSWAAICSAAGKEQKSKINGAVNGVVITEDGSPADNFKVCTQVHTHQSGMEQTLTCCPTITDHDGRFTIEHLKPGTYELLATNDVEGYSIANQSPGQNVSVSEKDPRPRVTIHLHNRGAVVVGSITDKETGKIIQHAHLQYTGIDCEAGGDILEDDGRYYPLAIPTDCDVVLIARAAGYRGWVYTETANPPRPVLRLAAGQRKLLSIELEPLPANTTEH